MQKIILNSVFINDHTHNRVGNHLQILKLQDKKTEWEILAARGQFSMCREVYSQRGIHTHHFHYTSVFYNCNSNDVK